MWWDISPGTRAEFEHWHTHEHMPERLAIPGFRRGTRWIALSGEPSYFILYEAATFATITTGAYLDRLNDPTDWSRKMMPHHLNMVRSVCRVRASFGGGIGGVLATIRFSSAPRRRRSLFKWLATEVMPTLPLRKGLAYAHLLDSRAPAVSGQTTEQRIRGGDGNADAVLLIGGYDAEAVMAIVGAELGEDRFASAGAAHGRVEGVYRPVFSLAAQDKPDTLPVTVNPGP